VETSPILYEGMLGALIRGDYAIGYKVNKLHNCTICYLSLVLNMNRFNLL